MTELDREHPLPHSSLSHYLSGVQEDFKGEDLPSHHVSEYRIAHSMLTYLKNCEKDSSSNLSLVVSGKRQVPTRSDISFNLPGN